MHPVVLVLALLAVLLVLALPRKYVFAPIAFAALSAPFGAQLYAGGFHLYAARIVVLAAAGRLIWAKVVLRERLFSGGVTALDRTFCLWAFCRAVAFVALHKEGAIANQVAFCLDAYGAYILFRYIIRDEQDVLRALKVMVAIALVLGTSMLYEHLTRFNLFNLVRTTAIEPWLRGGRVRAQGPFGQSITAGCLGATLLPLCFWLWKSRKARLLGAVGVAASTVVTVTSFASTSFSACLGGCFALALWPIRKRMGTVRWGVAYAVLALALVMKAPVWYLIARVDFIGGHGWDRAFLIHQFARHVGSWWLFGTAENATWGNGTWDTCNQFIAEAASGGLVVLGLFVVLVCRGFGVIGQARRNAGGDKRREWLFWCLGAALFAHVLAFQGVAYFDQSRVWWFAFLAMIPAATSSFVRVRRDAAAEGSTEATTLSNREEMATAQLTRTT